MPADQAAPLTAYQPAKLPTYASVNNDLSAYGDKDRDVKPAGGVVRGGAPAARFTAAPPAAPTATESLGASAAAAAAATEAPTATAKSAVVITTTNDPALDLDLRKVEFTTGTLLRHFALISR